MRRPRQPPRSASLFSHLLFRARFNVSFLAVSDLFFNVSTPSVSKAFAWYSLPAARRARMENLNPSNPGTSCEHIFHLSSPALILLTMEFSGKLRRGGTPLGVHAAARRCQG